LVAVSINWPPPTPITGIRHITGWEVFIEVRRSQGLIRCDDVIPSGGIASLDAELFPMSRSGVVGHVDVLAEPPPVSVGHQVWKIRIVGWQELPLVNRVDEPGGFCPVVDRSPTA